MSATGIHPRRSFTIPFAEAMVALGDWAVFALQALSGMLRRSFPGREFLRVCYEIGYASTAVVALTGLFIGMVLAVQTFSQFQVIGKETSLGAVIHLSVVRELGPVLAAIMLAGRVGSAMAAELATMRVTEQLDALACLGVHPVRYLASPRVLACVIMIPLLTAVADVMGIAGSSFISLYVFQIDSYHYWRHTQEYVRAWDLFTGLGKAVVFGLVLSLVACHRGFRARAGAAGVGRAATEAFVYSFIAIIVLDFFIALFANTLHAMLWPAAPVKLA
jgi:phospholipid/cholesterol/gamma-HCH transport system permease protein